MEQLLILGVLLFLGFLVYVYVKFFKKSEDYADCPLKALVADRAEFVLS